MYIQKYTVIFSLFFLLGIGAASIEVNSPKAALIEHLNAAKAGDLTALLAGMYAQPDEDPALLKLVAEIALSKSNYGKAMSDHFGKESADRLGVTCDAAIARINSAQESIHDDQADITFKGEDSSTGIILLRSAGRWRVPTTAVTPRVENAAPHEISGRYINIAGAYTETAAEIKAGQYPTAAAAVQALADRVKNAAAGADSQ